MGAFSSVVILINELYNRGAIEGISIDSIKLGGGALGAAVYLRKSLIKWWGMGMPSKEKEQVRLEARHALQKVELLKDAADLAMYITIFAIKVIGVVILTASQTRVRALSLVLDYQAQWLLGCFATATGASLVSHYSSHYIDRFVELNGR